MLSIIILEDLYRSEYFCLASLWLIFKFPFSESQVSRPWAGPGPAQWVFKLWIQLLEVLIFLIRNASVCSKIILKNLYWSEFGFLVSFWLNFHFFVFSNSTYFESGPAHFQNCLNFWSWKKSFLLKNIFFFAFYERLSFFDGKYGYFSTFDQQISAEKLVFRFL